MTGRKTILQAPAGEDTTSDGTEAFPVTGSKYMFVSTIAAYIRTLTQTLTNKTIDLTSNTLTGTKAQFNTAMSDADFATLTGSEALTNKTLTAPTMADFTNAQHDHGDADDGGTIAESVITFTDITTNNSSTSKHGFIKKLDNDSAHFMDGTGAWATPSVAASVATDAIWDAKGDLAVGTGANTAAKLTVGSNGKILSANSGEATGLEWIAAGASALPVNGWVSDANTWTYTSADGPTGVFGINADMTGILQAGTRIQLTQTTAKYFIITAVGAFSGGSTPITVYGGTDYTLANAAITSPYYSPVKVPFGFPASPVKWTETATDTTLRTQATPTQNTWYNMGSVTLSIPIGVWYASYDVSPQYSDASSSTWEIQTTLSTANNSDSDHDFLAALAGVSHTGEYVTLHRSKTLTLAAKTSYYLNTRTITTGLDNMYNRNDVSSAFVRAVCAYL